MRPALQTFTNSPFPQQTSRGRVTRDHKIIRHSCPWAGHAHTTPRIDACKRERPKFGDAPDIRVLYCPKPLACGRILDDKPSSPVTARVNTPVGPEHDVLGVFKGIRCNPLWRSRAGFRQKRSENAYCKKQPAPIFQRLRVTHTDVCNTGNTRTRLVQSVTALLSAQDRLAF